jgi:hypothetical protein
MEHAINQNKKNTHTNKQTNKLVMKVEFANCYVKKLL